MEPYSYYIISAFAVSLIILAGLAVESIRHLLQAERKLKALQGESNES